MPAPPSASDPSLRQLLRQLWAHLARRRRIQLVVLLLVMLASSVAEVVSLAAVLPFLAVLANPEGLWSQPLVQQWAPRLGITSAQELLLPITLIFATATVASGSIRLLNLWLNNRLSAAIGSDLSCEAYRRTLYQPYSVHLARNSSELVASVSVDVNIVITQVLNPLLLLVSSGLIVLSLVLTLLTIDWSIAVSSALVVSSVYCCCVYRSRRPLLQLGVRQVELNQNLIKCLQEGLGAVREVLLDGSQSFYVADYLRTDRGLRRVTADARFLKSYPRLVIEPLGMVLIAVMGFLLVREQGVDKALPLLGALALGAQKLLPLGQKIYEGWAGTRNAKYSLANVIRLVSQPLNSDFNNQKPLALEMKRCIRFEAVHFSYGTGRPVVLEGVDLDIRKGDRIGIIGTTGSGKSTAIDLLMGLLVPTAGAISIDGENLHAPEHPERLLAWRASIGNVPQNIYLSDSSILENIAFGVPKDQIDFPRVRQVAKEAQVASFIESTPYGYATKVGERGISLSGGQRQRLGIARALYKRPKILVFDEATSALDGETESAVIQAIEKLDKQITIVMIAHRVSTLQKCQKIFEIVDGHILLLEGGGSGLNAEKFIPFGMKA